MTDVYPAVGQRLALVPVTLNDKPFFDRVFSTVAQPVSDYTFANVFVWSTTMRLGWAVIENHLCLFSNGSSDLTMLLPPIPVKPVDAGALRRCLVRCFEFMDDHQRSHGLSCQRSRIEYVSDEFLENILAVTGAGGEFSLCALPFPGDYIYPSEVIIELAGKALKSRRHDRNRFIRLHPDRRVEPLEDSHLDDCLALLTLWERRAQDQHPGQLSEDGTATPTDWLRRSESEACRLALRARRALGLKGMVVYVGSTLVGFTLGESLGCLQASILFEKTHPDYDGAAPFIFSEFCRQYWSDMPEINVGDDWGIPTLRWTKESYRPSRRLAKYTLVRPVTARPLRPADLRDIDALVQIELASFGSDNCFSRRNIHDLIVNPGVICRVAEVHDRVVGWAVGLVRQYRSHRSGRLYTLAVDQEARGRGLGRMLVEEILRELAQRQVKTVYLEVESDNRPATVLYEKMGFRYRRVLRHYYGEGRDGWSMSRPIAVGSTALADESGLFPR